MTWTTCPICGAPNCPAVTGGGYWCPRCATRVDRLALARERLDARTMAGIQADVFVARSQFARILEAA